jgi:hypothetical protein
MDTIPRTPSDQAKEEARQHPNGWVYVIDDKYGPEDHVPADAIVGVWKVDGSGNIVGDFIPNPNYRGAA